MPRDGLSPKTAPVCLLLHPYRVKPLAPVCRGSSSMSLTSARPRSRGAYATTGAPTSAAQPLGLLAAEVGCAAPRSAAGECQGDIKAQGSGVGRGAFTRSRCGVCTAQAAAAAAFTRYRDVAQVFLLRFNLFFSFQSQFVKFLAGSCVWRRSSSLKGGRQQHLRGRCRRPPATKPSKVPAAPRLRATPRRGGLHLRHAQRPRHAATLPRGSPRLVGRLLHCSAAGVLRCAAGARALLSTWAAPSFPVQAW